MANSADLQPGFYWGYFTTETTPHPAIMELGDLDPPKFFLAGIEGGFSPSEITIIGERLLPPTVPAKEA